MQLLSRIECVVRRMAIETHAPFTAEQERDWSVIYGSGQTSSARTRTEYYYRHRETRAEYLYLMGGFCPPGDVLPGFAVVVGLSRNEDPATARRVIHVLAEAEAASLEGLVWECLVLKKKYGAYPVLCEGWAADVDRVTYLRIDEIVSRISTTQIEVQRFHPLPGTYSYCEGSCFGDYLSLLAQYQEILDRGNCGRLRGYMDKVHLQDRSKLKPGDNPATAALAYAVTELMFHKPWEMDVEQQFTREVDDPWAEMQW